MKNLLLALTLPCGMVLAQSLGPYTASSNFAADLFGMTDSRPGCWGHSDLATWNITFNPPAGYRVRILSIHGDLVSWIKSIPGDPPTPAESVAGVLLGLQSTPVERDTRRCDLCSDVASRVAVSRPSVQGTTILYAQDSVAQSMPKSRVQYDIDNIDQFLERDHKLLVTVASWLNTTNKPIHVEPTFTVVYRFDPGAGNAN